MFRETPKVPTPSEPAETTTASVSSTPWHTRIFDRLKHARTSNDIKLKVRCINLFGIAVEGVELQVPPWLAAIIALTEVVLRMSP